MDVDTKVLFRPFVRWAGGKRQLLPELRKRVPATFGRYIEPFVGGGALFWDLAASGRPEVRHAILADMNEELISSYKAIRSSSLNEIIERLAWLQEHHGPTQYAEMRAKNWKDLRSFSAIAVRFIYLNKTCWNGLYRVNRQGRFNVPMGKFKHTPLVCDEPNLRACHEALRGIEIYHQGYVETMAMAKKGDFVYLDPPYLPISKTSDFTAFTATGFGLDDHKRLSEEALKLKRRGVNVLLSNSGCDDIRRIYEKDFKIEEVSARRMINSNYMLRGNVSEFLIS